MDPATVAGLALAVVPLMLFALENYEHAFQPIIIFTRHYRREVERFQMALKIQKVVFQNECCLLLDRVQLSQGDVMIGDLTHPLWRDNNLEDRIRLQLDESYDACISSLFLINQILAEILKETGTLEILAQKVFNQISRSTLDSSRYPRDFDGVQIAGIKEKSFVT